MQPYDRNDRMTRLVFCREYGINQDTEKHARAQGWSWPPFVVLGRRVFYSRQRCAEWFSQQESQSQSQSQSAVADV